jgi:hypothetical protein
MEENVFVKGWEGYLKNFIQSAYLLHVSFFSLDWYGQSYREVATGFIVGWHW